MNVAHAVIGAGYGDEGKGLITDYLARKLASDGSQVLVARCNGGAQAGHTVVDDSRRHIFSHFGSGSLAGANTYLGSNFIISPDFFVKEQKMLAAIKVDPGVFAHPQCRVTTIFDMALNSLVELGRGSARHGSCGMGINETVTRHRAGFFLTAEMLRSPISGIANTLQRIRDQWVPQRLANITSVKSGIGMDRADKDRADLYLRMLDINTTEMAEKLQSFIAGINLIDPKTCYPIDKLQLVVEGAQGLMIDEFLGEFPHVTRSVTGLASHVAAANECGFYEVQPLYLTRAYATRHGAGPLPLEGLNITSKRMRDRTNVDNQWQGSLRYAPLDVDKLKRIITKDLARGSAVAQVTSTNILPPKVVVTCIDQLGEKTNILYRGRLEMVDSTDIHRIIEHSLGMELFATSHGPMAINVINRSQD